jgi:hypothetical protein
MRWKTDEHEWEPGDEGDPEHDGDEEWVADEDDISLQELAEQDENTLVPCPHCNELVHEDSQRCPYCEQYISEEDARPRRKPWWIIIGLLVTLAIAIMWAFRG